MCYMPTTPPLLMCTGTSGPQKEHFHMICLLINRLTNISKWLFILAVLIFSIKSEEGHKAITWSKKKKTWICQKKNQYMESQNLVTQGNVSFQTDSLGAPGTRLSPGWRLHYLRKSPVTALGFLYPSVSQK